MDVAEIEPERRSGEADNRRRGNRHSGHCHCVPRYG
jgi:hypothetical protein